MSGAVALSVVEGDDAECADLTAQLVDAVNSNPAMEQRNAPLVPFKLLTMDVSRFGGTVQMLEEEINAHIAKGYEPHGPVCSQSSPDSEIVTFVQAMMIPIDSRRATR